MKLDRDLNPTGKGKYALINMRKIPSNPTTALELAEAIRLNPEAVEFGEVGSPGEFWLVKLKDENADVCLYGYAGKILAKDPEFAAEVSNMAKRSGPNSPYCKAPD